MTFELTDLEMHLAHGCNLRCPSCNHFSNNQLSGLVTLAQVMSWIAPWVDRLRPLTFKLLGGEPLFNPDAGKIAEYVRSCFPSTRLLLMTNGLLLGRQKPSFFESLRIAMCSVVVTTHAPLKDSKAAIDILTNEGITGWTRSENPWYELYRGEGENVSPISSSDGKKSWENCLARYCHQLFDGKLWKCSMVAYLPLVAKKYPQITSRWPQTLDYVPLPPEASDQQLKEFVLEQEISACQLCPENPKRRTP